MARDRLVVVGEGGSVLEVLDEAPAVVARVRDLGLVRGEAAEVGVAVPVVPAAPRRLGRVEAVLLCKVIMK